MTVENELKMVVVVRSENEQAVEEGVLHRTQEICVVSACFDKSTLRKCGWAKKIRHFFSNFPLFVPFSSPI